MQVEFWRAFFALMIHYMTILCTLSLSRILGFFQNVEIFNKIDDILDRPADDSVDVFSKVR